MGEETKVDIIERLTRIESKLDDYKEIQKISREAHSASKTNSQRIEALEDRNKWITRTMVGAILCEIVGLGFMIFQAGIGG